MMEKLSGSISSMEFYDGQKCPMHLENGTTTAANVIFMIDFDSGLYTTSIIFSLALNCIRRSFNWMRFKIVWWKKSLISVEK